MTWIASSVSASVVGLPPEHAAGGVTRARSRRSSGCRSPSLSVANSDAVTVGSRVAGFVTNGPTVIRSVATSICA